MALWRILFAACLCLCSSPVEAEPHAVTSVLLLAEANLVLGQLSPRRRTGFRMSPRRRTYVSTPRRRTYVSTPRRRTYVSPRRRTYVSTPRRRTYYSTPRRRTIIIVSPRRRRHYGGYDYDDDDNYRRGCYHSNGGGNGGGIGGIIILICCCFGCAYCFCRKSGGSSQVAVDQQPLIQVDAEPERTQNRFGFPEAPEGISRQVVSDFVEALRAEYVNGVNNSVGDFMGSDAAQATGGGMEIFDRVEQQIREMNPDNRNDALDNLSSVWGKFE